MWKETLSNPLYRKNAVIAWLFNIWCVLIKKNCEIKTTNVENVLRRLMRNFNCVGEKCFHCPIILMSKNMSDKHTYNVTKANKTKRQLLKKKYHLCRRVDYNFGCVLCYINPYTSYILIYRLYTTPPTSRISNFPQSTYCHCV